MKIATWNVNSLRVRLPHILTWLDTHQPDVFALQETKVQDDQFPIAAFTEVGYHVEYTGQKTYNGMATLSKKPLLDVQKEIPGCNPLERRVLGATLDGVRIWNVYIPNGESPQSEKYPYKLDWLNHLKLFLTKELLTHSKLVILGDFNIAPEDRDVYDPKQWEGQVLFSEPEKEMLRQLIGLGLQDCFRLHTQTDKNYTWWDYRLNAFKRNMGLRIDHILASTKLAKMCKSCVIDKTPREWERPSDHTPVMAEFGVRLGIVIPPLPNPLLHQKRGGEGGALA